MKSSSVGLGAGCWAEEEARARTKKLNNERQQQRFLNIGSRSLLSDQITSGDWRQSTFARPEFQVPDCAFTPTVLQAKEQGTGGEAKSRRRNVSGSPSSTPSVSL